MKLINYNRLKRYTIAATILNILLMVIFISVCRANDYSQFTDEQIVEAIGKAENSVKFPYGIKSIDTKSDKDYAKQICLNSVKNGRKRWIKANKPCDLIEYISRRYCPINAPDDNGTNKHWSKNVKYFLDNPNKGGE